MSTNSQTRPAPKPPTQPAVNYLRNFPLEDLNIQPGDGRTVEAYCAVFDVPAEIRDQDGHYSEVIDRGAFTQAINAARPAGGREAWKTGVFFNHGRDLYGGASDMFSIPIGTCIDMRADKRGVLTVTRYHSSQEQILEAIREGSLCAYSFQGAFLRSDPPSSRSKYERGRDGRLPTVRRLISTLREYGPTPFPAYKAAEIVGVRSEDTEPARHPQHAKYSAMRARLIVAGLSPNDYPWPDRPESNPPAAMSDRQMRHVVFSSRTRQVCDRLGIDFRDGSSR